MLVRELLQPSLTRKRSGVRNPQRPPLKPLVRGLRGDPAVRQYTQGLNCDGGRVSHIYDATELGALTLRVQTAVLLVATSVDELRVPTCRAAPWTALWFVEEEAPHGAPTVGRLVPWDIGQTARSLQSNARREPPFSANRIAHTCNPSDQRTPRNQRTARGRLFTPPVMR